MPTKSNPENTKQKSKKQDKLLEMVKTSCTQYWNDSCSIKELKYAIERGASGATTNPVIVNTVLSQEFDVYKSVLQKAILTQKTATEDDIVWHMIEYAAVEGAKLLAKKFPNAGAKTGVTSAKLSNQGKGRISIQTNTKYYQNTEELIAQALHFNTLAKNMQIKLPATAAGIKAIEEVTYQGASINATVSFTVPQALAVAEAVERGLKRRVKESKSNASINPVCTIMVGRIDDWLKKFADSKNIIIDQDCLEWAGVAVFKQAYKIYTAKKYSTRLLAAAYRNHYHWSEFIGGDVIETIPYKWQVKFNNSSIEVKPRMDNPVDPKILTQLKKLKDFNRAFEPDGLNYKEFDSFGATVQTLLQFAAGYDDLVKLIRNKMIHLK